MPSIMPLSDLLNYNAVLEHVTEDRPVFLTKDGCGKYAIVDISAFERLNAELKLVSALVEGEACAYRKGWVSANDAKRRLGAE